MKNQAKQQVIEYSEVTAAEYEALMRELESNPNDGIDSEDVQIQQQYVQWTSSDDKTFQPAARSVGKLKPGLYEVRYNQQIGMYLERVKMHLDGLVNFPDSNTDKVISEIEKFWDRESTFKKYRQPFKRGMLLWGPPGSGKTCTIKMAISSLIKKRKGIVLKFTTPDLFSQALRIIREIQPDTPIIVLMEDIDSIIENFVESEVINLLDGVDSVNKVVFLATTNYPEKLGERLLNRPSRFDKRFYIGMPNAGHRRVYLKHIAQDAKINMNRWVADTDGFSISHIKELFTQVHILGDDYEEALETLKEMKIQISSDDDGGKIGLH